MKNESHLVELENHPDVNQILELLSGDLVNMLNENLAGMYLTGSLTYGDFDRGSSDIDFVVVLNSKLSEEEVLKVEKIHLNIGSKYPEWKKRIEGSYITKSMLSSVHPPQEPRPYFNAGKMWSFNFGNEWVINNYMLYHSGVTLVGPNVKDLIKPIDIKEVRKASRLNLMTEWKDVLNNPKALTTNNDYDGSHLQAYAIMSMCRVLFTAENSSVVSKKVAADWVQNKHGEEWSGLIESGKTWVHGKELSLKKEVKEFIKFTIDRIGDDSVEM